MKLYRVEDSDRQGCYASFPRSLEMLEMAERHVKTYDKHPNPTRDSGIQRHIDSDERCAFSDIEQLLDWFTEPELEMLRNNGFNVVEFEATPTVIGAKQVLFKSDSRKDVVKC